MSRLSGRSCARTRRFKRSSAQPAKLLMCAAPYPCVQPGAPCRKQRCTTSLQPVENVKLHLQDTRGALEQAQRQVAALESTLAGGEWV